MADQAIGDSSGILPFFLQTVGAGALALGVYILVTGWETGKSAPELLQQAQQTYREGDDVKAAMLVDRALKEKPEPALAAELNSLYRAIVIGRKLRVIEGLIADKRHRAAGIQLRRVLAEQPNNARARALLRTVANLASSPRQPP